MGQSKQSYQFFLQEYHQRTIPQAGNGLSTFFKEKEIDRACLMCGVIEGDFVKIQLPVSEQIADEILRRSDLNHDTFEFRLTLEIVDSATFPNQ